MRLRTCTAGLIVALVGTAVPASAQIVQSVQVGVGAVFPTGFDARANGDVLVRDIVGASLPAAPDLTDALAFSIKDFRAGQLFGEWDVTFGNHLEVGAGVGYHQRSVPSVYNDLVDQQGGEIEQTLRLRVVPVSGVVRFLPFGRAGGVQPYVGVGAAALQFRYSEIGRFVDPTTLDLFDDRFVTSGTAPGGILLGGIRVPMGGDIYGLGLEVRHVFGVGNTGGLAKGFLGDKIDLGNTQLNFSLLVHF